MAKLADAADLKSAGPKGVGLRPLLSTKEAFGNEIVLMWSFLI